MPLYIYIGKRRGAAKGAGIQARRHHVQAHSLNPKLQTLGVDFLNSKEYSRTLTFEVEF